MLFVIGMGFTLISEIPWVQDWFLPFAIEDRILGTWVVSIIGFSFLFTSVTGIRADLEKLFKHNRQEEAANRSIFEYDVLAVLRENYPTAESWRIHYLNQIAFRGEAVCGAPQLKTTWFRLNSIQ